MLSLSASDADAALEYLGRIPSTSPPSVLVEMTRSQTYLLKGDFARALSVAQKANRIDITCLPVYKLLAQAFQLNDRAADSIAPLQTYLTYESTDTEALALMAHALIADGKYEEALQYANDALELDKESLPALIARGEIYLQQEKVEEALVDFNAALRLDKNSFEANIGIARIQISRTLFGSAYEYSRAAYNLAQTNPQKATALYYRALALIGLDENDASAKDLEELLKYPEDVLPADLYENALKVYEQVVTPTPTSTLTRTPTPASRSTPSPSATPRK
jgi:tetratricopeptide (TPR) repeat protein